MVTTPISFVQSIDEYIESYHLRSDFSRQRMGQAWADAFDHEARQILLIPYEEGVVTLQGQAPLSGRFQEISEYVSSIHKRRLLYLYKAFSLVLTDGSTIEIEQSVWQ